LPRAFYVPGSSSIPSLARLVEGDVAQGLVGARVVSYAPERVVVEVEADRPGNVVLTDAFYPGWQATVDGSEVPILRAEPYFRAVPVEAGRHRVEFAYRPLSLRLGSALSGLSMLVGLVVLALGGMRGRRKERKRGPSDGQLQ
jgi:uncharacterized membrane protein YfhO